MKRRMRWFALFLAVAMCVSLLPAQALAADEDAGAAEQTETFSPAEEPGELSAASEGQAYAPGDDGSDTPEELFLQYAESELYGAAASGTGPRKAARNTAGRLTGVDAAIYAKLMEYIPLVAAGERASTVFEVPVEDLGLEKLSWTAAELGVDAVVVENGDTLSISDEATAAAGEMAAYDLSVIIDALLADNPYTMYWYDKTVGSRASGYSYGASYDYDLDEYVLTLKNSITLYFAVAEEYSAGEYTVDTAKGQAVQTSVANARGIVDRYVGSSDYDKLAAYRQEICALVAYNHSAAGGGVAYGNPWQLIWVFDGDDTTDVVCEGYSKAFQYLCDLTDFSGGTTCVSVTGTMSGGTGAGRHMWNIVTMDDGKNYLVDVTNCDEGSIGADDQLFMAAYSSGSVGSGYVYICEGGSITYTYDGETLNYYTEGELTMSSAAYTGPEETPFTYTVKTDGTLEITGYTGEDVDVAVPTEINGKTVTSIGADVFDYNETLESVNIPDTVTDIGDFAFSDCENLSRVTLSANLKTIGTGAFSHLPLLTELELPDGLEVIGEDGLRGTGLISVVIPDSVTALGNNALSECPDLVSAVLPSGLTEIPQYEFKACTSLAEIVIPENVTSIGKWAFYNCESLQDITIPSGVRELGTLAFAGTGISEITIPDGMTSVGSWAFSRCASLASVTMPASITTVEEGAFAVCDALTDVFYCGTEEDWAQIVIGASNDPLTGATIHYTEAAVKYEVPGGYITFDPETGTVTGYEGEPTDVVIPGQIGDVTVTGISVGAFASCTSITSVTIPGTVAQVPMAAFYSCTSLTSVVISSGVESISTEAFEGCAALTDVTIPVTVTDIYAGAFSGCTALTDAYYAGTAEQWSAMTVGTGNDPLTGATIHYAGPVTSGTFGDGLTWTYDPDTRTLTISGTGAMSGLIDGVPWEEYSAEVQTVVVEDGVTSVGNVAFYRFTSLTSVTLPESVTLIEGYAFFCCSILEEISIPSGVIRIDNAAFAGCSSLKEVVIPTGVVNIGYGAFDGCSGLTAVTIPGSVATFQRSVFHNCTGLESVVIEEGVTAIGDSAFDGCSAINEVTLPLSLKTVGLNAFTSSTALTDVYYGGTEEQWAEINICSGNDPLLSATVHCIQTLEITAQPEDKTVAAKSRVTLTVEAEGAESYQWQYSTDGTTWKNCSSAGYNTASFGFTASTGLNGRQYRCVVTDADGNSLASDAMTLTVLGITANPSSQEVAASATAAFKVTAVGAESYQWQYSIDGTTWRNCSSAGYNTATFSFKAGVSLDGRQYRCAVKNGSLTVYSSAATLTVIAKPTISTQPKTQSVAAGTKATFTVAATGTGLTYQWQYSTDGTTWKNCSSTGYNTATFSFTASASLNGRQYRCVVKNTAGSVNSTAARLTVISKPAITTQPKAQSVAAGKKATFTVAATGTGLTYQWQYSTDGTTWKNCSSTGYNTATFSFTASASLNGRQYRCVVKNTAGSVNSTAAKLTVIAKPTISTQPKAQSVAAGTKATFTVAATGTGLTYQWQYSTDGTTWKNCSSTGYNTATFSFTASASLNGRQYRCVVKNTAGSVNSTAARLTVISKPAISTQPKAQSVAAGTKATFTIKATGTGLTYQWQYSTDGTTWKNCSSTGYNTATFSFTASASLNGRQYRCVVKNTAGSVNSTAAKLTVK